MVMMWLRFHRFKVEKFCSFNIYNKNGSEKIFIALLRNNIFIYKTIMILLNETEKYEVIYDGFNNGDQKHIYIYMTRFFYFITYYFFFYIFSTLYNEKRII